MFELEKALYELRYELNNRPSWAGIPLQGILEWCESRSAKTTVMQSIDMVLDTTREFLHQAAALPAASGAGAVRDSWSDGWLPRSYASPLKAGHCVPSISTC
jgi:hypothetical protein